LKGVLSTGFLALITSLVGGTKVQCSGPTVPMTAVTDTITDYTSTDFAGQQARFVHQHDHSFAEVGALFSDNFPMEYRVVCAFGRESNSICSPARYAPHIHD